MGKTQHWITCLDPTNLIDKYESDYPNGHVYVQGDPFEKNRAVVLSRPQLDRAKENLLLVPDLTQTTILKETFLTKFKSVCEQAARHNEPVCLVITAHGDIDESDGDLWIGTKEYGPSKYLMSRTEVQTAIGHIKGLKLTAFFTSCFSGHWVITPDWAGATTDSTIIAATRPNQESHTWLRSTAGRYAGGPMSTYAVQEILREGQVEMDPSLLPMSGILSNPRPASANDRLWIEYCEAVRIDMARLAVRGYKFGSTPIFHPVGGHDRFWTRTGYPIENYYENWLKFPKLDRSYHARPDKDKGRLLDDVPDSEVKAYEEFIATSVWAGDIEFPGSPDTRTGSWSRAMGNKATSQTKSLAITYLKSNPGLDSVSENRWAYSSCIEILKGQLKQELIPALYTNLRYRILSMRSAQSLFRDLNLGPTGLPLLKDWIWEEWGSQNLDPTTERGSQHLDLFNKHLKVIKTWPLYTPRLDEVIGSRWYKPHRYLAAACFITLKDPQTEYNRLIEAKQMSTRSMVKEIIAGSRRLRETVSRVRTWRAASKRTRKSVQGVFDN